MRRLRPLLLASLALAGCNQILGIPEVHEDPPRADGGGPGGPDAAPPVDAGPDARADQVVGTAMTVFVNHDGTQTVGQLGGVARAQHGPVPA